MTETEYTLPSPEDLARIAKSYDVTSREGENYNLAVESMLNDPSDKYFPRQKIMQLFYTHVRDVVEPENTVEEEASEQEKKEKAIV